MSHMVCPHTVVFIMTASPPATVSRTKLTLREDRESTQDTVGLKMCWAGLWGFGTYSSFHATLFLNCF